MLTFIKFPLGAELSHNNRRSGLRLSFSCITLHPKSKAEPAHINQSPGEPVGMGGHLGPCPHHPYLMPFPAAPLVLP